MSANAATVSKTLKTRFIRSTSESTRIRGWSDVTSGFVVKSSGLNSIVTWNSSRGFTTQSHDETMATISSKIQSMQSFLIEKGYSVTSDGFALFVSKSN